MIFEGPGSWVRSQARHSGVNFFIYPCVYSCYTIFVISFFYERWVAYVFFTWSVISSLEESKLTSWFLLLHLNWISAKEEKKNLAETNFSDQRRRQDDICHSILNKISFICIMTYRHSVWCKKITPSLHIIRHRPNGEGSTN